MFSWFKKFFEKKEKCIKSESSMKELLESCIMDCKKSSDANMHDSGMPFDYPEELNPLRYKNEFTFFFYNRYELIPIFHYYFDKEEVCENLIKMENFNDGIMYHNVRIEEIEVEERANRFEVRCSYEFRELIHKETSLSVLKSLFSDYHLMKGDEYMKYRDDLVKYGYTFEARGNRLYLREPKEEK